MAKQVGLMSDTHGYLDPRVFKFFADVDEIWHAGDFGDLDVCQALAEFKPLRGVYGNIDGPEIRDVYPLDQRFEFAGVDVWITHIGGYPGKYDRRVRSLIRKDPPDLFIAGHSHILKVKPDKKLDLLHLNPGAAGRQGFHTILTMMLLHFQNGKLDRLQAVELGPRSLASKDSALHDG